MALETAIANALLAAGPVAALVGTRVRPLGAAAGDARPYLAYQVTSRKTNPTLSDGPGKYRKAEFDVAVVTDRYSQAFELSDAVRAALDDLSRTGDGTEMHLTFDDETDVEEQTDEDETQQTAWVRRMTFRALYCAAP